MGEPPRTEAGPWGLRVAVISAFAATLWLAGPKAWAVLSARLASGPRAGPQIELDRVALRGAPEWLRGALLAAVLRELEPTLRGRVAVEDAAALADVRARLLASPWVTDVRLGRHPDRPTNLSLDLELREPVIAIRLDGDVVALADADGYLLPPPPGRVDLPDVVLSRDPRGLHVPAPRVRSAARVALEWRERVAPHVDPAPRLLEVDVGNLGGAFVADPRYSEVMIAVAGRDGPVWLQYGRAADDEGPIGASTKATVLASLLAEYPNLGGLVGGDLRLSNRWRDCVVRRAEDSGAARIGRAPPVR